MSRVVRSERPIPLWSRSGIHAPCAMLLDLLPVLRDS